MICNMYLFLLPLLFIVSNGLQNVIFLVPFEISFSDTNQFGFTINYFQHFIESSSTFFNVQNENITIAFIKDLSVTHYIDIGFTVSSNTFEQENAIKNKDIQSYRSYLMSTNNLPPIIGIESKYKSCSNGKYASFYHYNIECQWLCPHLSIYENHTNECQSVANMSSTIQISETNTSKFIFIGYISSLFVTTIICIIFAVGICIKNNPNFLQNKATKPRLKKKKSLYFYHDTENDDASNEENEGNQDKSNANFEITQNVEIGPFPENKNDISLSAKSSVVNSVLQSPTTQNDEIYRETTLGALEDIECDEKLKKMKSMIIEEGRLEQFKLIDRLDEFRENVADEIEKEHSEKQQKIKSEYLVSVKNVMEEKEMNEVEKEKKLTNLEIQYKETNNKLEKQDGDRKKNKVNIYKQDIKEQLLNVKNKTTAKLNKLIQDDQQNTT